MLIAVNIGNNEILLGFFKNDELQSTASIACEPNRTPDEYACLIKNIMSFRGLSPEDFEGAICSSVVPSVTEAVRSATHMLCGFRPHLLGAGIKTGLNIKTDDPTQLGGDLVAASIGALKGYKPPMILIDFGTATTFSVLDENGSFIGCSIAPGMLISAQALSSGASLLPQFASLAPKRCIGTNTLESMQSGSIFGSVAMIDGMIRRIEKELSRSATIIASGKLADIIIPLCEREIIRDDTLLLKGLAHIYLKNKKRHRTNK